MLRFLRLLIRPYRWLLMIVLAAMLIEMLVSLAAPWPLKLVLDTVMGQVGRREIPLLAGMSLITIAVIGAIASYVDSYFRETFAQGIGHDLRMRTYHQMQRLSLSYHDKHRIAVSLSTLTADIDAIQDFASSGTLEILIDVLAVCGMFVVMLWLNWPFALLAAAVAPFLLWFVGRHKRALKDAIKIVRSNEAEMVAVEIHGLESQRLIEAFGTQEIEEKRLKLASQATVKSALRSRRIKATISPVVAVTVAACTAVVLWKGAALVFEGTMTAGELTVMLAYLARFFKPLQDLAKVTNSMSQVGVAAERLQGILEADEVIPERPNARPARFQQGEITFRRVGFEYVAGSPVLKDVSFRIPAGQFVGIVGATGSGKSSIASLIPRFYDPTRGMISVDGIDIREFQLQSLRQRFGFVLQETVLFHGTLAENIAYGRPGASAREVEEAARLANADEFIERLPAGYQTIVGDRGMSLSGGQRQRIGIARAFIRNSPILILDEPTAALDSEAEAHVMQGLMRLMKGKTVIMIAHHLPALEAADNIIVLKDGMIAEQGTHRMLLSNGGIYAGLYHTRAAAFQEFV